MTHQLARTSRIAQPAVLLGPAQGHLATLKELLSGSATAGQRRRTYALAGEASLLIGRLAQLLNRWPESHMHLSWSISLAKESGDGILRAHALGAMSALHSRIPRGGRGGDPARAIELLNAAIDATGGTTSPYLLAWVHARRAEEHAVADDSTQAWRDLEAAGRALAGAATPDDGFFRHLDGAWLAGYRGNCARLLKEPTEAISALELGLQSISSERAGHRSGVLADLAAAYALPGRTQDIDRACALLADSLILADHSGASVAQQRISGILRHELHPWTNAPEVRDLDQRLGAQITAPSE
jgi:tetratricopeptide (TPR) repeat protein